MLKSGGLQVGVSRWASTCVVSVDCCLLCQGCVRLFFSPPFILHQNLFWTMLPTLPQVQFPFALQAGSDCNDL